MRGCEHASLQTAELKHSKALLSTSILPFVPTHHLGSLFTITCRNKFCMMRQRSSLQSLLMCSCAPCRMCLSPGPQWLPLIKGNVRDCVLGILDGKGPKSSISIRQMLVWSNARRKKKSQNHTGFLFLLLFNVFGTLGSTIVPPSEVIQPGGVGTCVLLCAFLAVFEGSETLFFF